MRPVWLSPYTCNSEVKKKMVSNWTDETKALLLMQANEDNGAAFEDRLEYSGSFGADVWTVS